MLLYTVLFSLLPFKSRQLQKGLKKITLFICIQRRVRILIPTWIFSLKSVSRRINFLKILRTIFVLLIILHVSDNYFNLFEGIRVLGIIACESFSQKSYSSCIDPRYFYQIGPKTRKVFRLCSSMLSKYSPNILLVKKNHRSRQKI